MYFYHERKAQKPQLGDGIPLNDLKTRWITSWLIIGPFPAFFSRKDYQIGHISGYDFDFLLDRGGEGKIEPFEGLTHTINIDQLSIPGFPKEFETQWKSSFYYDNFFKSIESRTVNLTDVEQLGYIDLGWVNRVNIPAVAYAACYLWSPTDQEVSIGVRTHCLMKLWINHKELTREITSNGSDHRVKTSLIEGYNIILLKIVNPKAHHASLRLGFYFRLTDENNDPLDLNASFPEGLRVELPTASGKIRIDSLQDSFLLRRKENKLYQTLLLRVTNLGSTQKAILMVKVEDKSFTLSSDLTFGTNIIEIPIPAVEKPSLVQVTLMDCNKTLIWDSRKIAVSPQPRNVTLFVVPGTHLDFGWVTSAPRCNELARDILDRALRYLNENFDYHWTVEAAFAIKDYLDKKPEMKDEIVRLLKERRLEICPNWKLWTGMTHDGEAVIRQITYSKEWLRKNLNYDSDIIQQYDIGDHAFQLPQILTKSGINRYLWNEHLDFKKQVDLTAYMWEGLDGSRIATIKAPPYNIGIQTFIGTFGNKTYGTTESIIAKVNALRKRLQNWPGNILYLPMEADLSPPLPFITELAKSWNEKYYSPRIKIGTPSQYFEELDRIEAFEGKTWRGQVTPSPPKWQGHLIYTRRWEAQTKLLYEILNGEKFAAINYLVTGRDYPFTELDRAWESLLYTEDHNYGGGGEVGELAIEGDLYQKDLIRQAHRIAMNVTNEALHEIASHVIPKPLGKPIVIFNPLSWTREDVVEIPYDGKGVIRDGDGNIIQSQLSLDGRRILIRVKVPPLGYRTYYLDETTSTKAAEPSITNKNYIENEFYKVTISRESGVIISIYDKELQRELLDTNDYFGNEFYVSDSNRQRYMLSQIELIEGPVMSYIAVNGSFGDMNFMQKIILIKGTKKIKIEDQWTNKADVSFRIFFPFSIENPEITYEVAYGAFETEALDDLTPSQKWINLYSKEDNISITLGKNFGRWGSSGSTLYSRIDSRDPTYDPYWTDGVPSALHVYQISSDEGDWKTSKAYRLGWETLNPLIAVMPESADGQLPEEMSFIQGLPDGVVLSVLKLSSIDKEVIIRLFEAYGDETEAKVIFFEPIKEAWETDLTEDLKGKLVPSGNSLTFELQGYEIKTLKIECQTGNYL